MWLKERAESAVYKQEGTMRRQVSCPAKDRCAGHRRGGGRPVKPEQAACHTPLPYVDRRPLLSTKQTFLIGQTGVSAPASATK